MPQEFTKVISLICKFIFIYIILNASTGAHNKMADTELQLYTTDPLSIYLKEVSVNRVLWMILLRYLVIQ